MVRMGHGLSFHDSSLFRFPTILYQRCEPIVNIG
jgi:hypothetical protein